MFAAIRVWLTTLFKPAEDKLRARIALIKARLEALEQKLEAKIKQASGS